MMTKISLTTEARAPSRSLGFTMIEVLVALVIMLVALLGLAGLQAKAQQAQLESYQRVQALILLNDMVDRINANRKAATCYALTTGLGTPYYGTGSSALSPCNGVAIASAQATATTDISEWDNLLKGAAELLGGTNTGSIRHARGCVASVVNADNSLTFTAVVAWQGMIPSTLPAAGGTTASTNAINCGTGLYGIDAASGLEMRRVVWTTTRIANLQ